MSDIRYVTAPLTLWEAALIKKLREYNMQFGKVTVTIQGGNPIYVVANESKEIKKNDGLNLDGSVAIDPINPDPI